MNRLVVGTGRVRLPVALLAAGVVLASCVSPPPHGEVMVAGGSIVERLAQDALAPQAGALHRAASPS